MSNSKFLSDSAWKDVAAKNKVKDNGLLKLLAEHKRLDEGEHDEVLGSLDEILKLAAQLKKAKDAAAAAPVVKYLTELVDTAETERRSVTKARAEAAAQTKKQQQAQKAQEAAKDDDEEEDVDEAGDSLEKLGRLLKSLKTSKAPYYFLVCDARPFGMVLSKKSIKSSAKHKKELAEMAGGNTRPPKFGTCLRDGNHLMLEMDKPLPGLARVLQRWLKANIGIPFKVSVGGESSDDEEGGDDEPRLAAGERAGREAPEDEPEETPEETPEAQDAEADTAAEVDPRIAAAELSAAAPKPKLAKAPDVWDGTRELLQNRISALKTAVQAQCSDEKADVLDEINSHLLKLDRILGKLDRRLSDSLAKAGQSQDAATRNAELKNAKTIFAEYIQYVKTEPLIEHLDSNPFGVKTDIKATLSASLTQLARAIA